MRPFLEDPKAATWDGPDGSLSTLKGEHWTLRNKRGRYLRYKNGEEELYDHNNDPREWTNLARNPEYAQQIKELSAKLNKQAGLKD